MSGPGQTNGASNAYDRHLGTNQSGLGSDDFASMLDEASKMGLAGMAAPTIPLESDTSAGLNQNTPAEFPLVGPLDRTSPDYWSQRYGKDVAGLIANIGGLHISSMRFYLSEMAHRLEPNPDLKNLPAINLLTAEALVPLIDWATGRSPAPGQTAQAFIDEAATNPVLGCFESIDQDDLRRQVNQLAGTAPLKNFPGKDFSIANIIQEAPVAMCSVVINMLSPNESSGAAHVAPALVRIRSILGVDK